MMVHGMCCTGDVWANFRAFFEARGARVFTPTLRPDLRQTIRQAPNRGLGELGFTDYVRQLEDEVRHITQETGRRPVVIGHSMGGLLAQVLAERAAVDAAVFISPSAPAGVRDLTANLFWSGVALSHRLGLAPWAIKSSRALVDRTVFNCIPAAERTAAYDAFVYESGRAFKDLGHWPVDEKRVRVPVLTIAASRDRLVPAKLVRLTAKKYAAAGGDFIEYREHGHWLYAEPGWQKPAADIHAWFDKVLAPANERPQVHGDAQYRVSGSQS
jgi:pimeloyl-ACP methyl ester carboxylesterase